MQTKASSTPLTVPLKEPTFGGSLLRATPSPWTVEALPPRVPRKGREHVSVMVGQVEQPWLNQHGSIRMPETPLPSMTVEVALRKRAKSSGDGRCPRQSASMAQS
jgi:hypothetical protein